jgi:queuine tRNA-ribosyltransferase
MLTKKIKNKILELPAFFPDATRGVIRSASSEDLTEAGVEGLVVNTYHLLSQPGPSVLKENKGIKNFMNWPGWIISDSGGFQMFSLIQKNKSLGKIKKDGVTFHLQSKSGRKKYDITPEKCIQIQFDINSDIMVVLDYFTPYKAKDDEIKLSVDWTIEWAKRCKDEFERQCQIRKLSEENRPILIGVVQGAHKKSERERCAKGLQSIGFDGYGYGGWPFDDDSNFDVDMTRFIPTLFENDTVLYGLGVGNPNAVIQSINAGWTLFDCVLPTRDARHKRLYVFNIDPFSNNLLQNENFYDYLYIGRERYIRDFSPISEYCDCFTCRNYSRAYLNHLFTIEDSLSWRLATIHNLRFYMMIIESARKYL